MTCPSLEHLPVIYLTTVVLRNIELFYNWHSTQSLLHLLSLLNVTQLAHLAVSLSINIYATSIIALKAWCVHVDGVFLREKSVDSALIDHMTCAYIQEIQQVTDAKRDWCPISDTGAQDIGSPHRVGCNLYSDWCKLCLDIQARVVTMFPSLQVSSLVTMTVCIRSGLPGIAEVFTPVGIQLAVRKQLLRNYPHGIDFVIWQLGNLPNCHSPARGEKPLVRLCIHFF